MYNAHPSRALNSLFADKPFQGESPDKAKFLFVGLDANYREDIESHSIFPKIREYHSDGVSFWKKYQVHHPFLLNEYSGDGRVYHRNFAQIGFTPRHAELVSFIELLHVPSVGESKLRVADLDPAHLARVQFWIMEGQAEHVFLPRRVRHLMSASGVFPWLPEEPISRRGELDVLYRANTKTVYLHYHFSAWAFAERKRKEAREIASLL